jgi:hypothetical protein
VRGMAGGGGALSRHRLLKGEMMGQRRFMGKLKRSWWHVGSAPYGCRKGCQRRRVARRRRLGATAARARPRKVTTPGGPSWAGVGHVLGLLQEIPKKIEAGCQGLRAKLKK